MLKITRCQGNMYVKSSLILVWTWRGRCHSRKIWLPELF